MNYLSLFKKYWPLILLVVVCTTLLSFVLSLIQTPKYLSSVDLLVIQKQGSKLDAYGAARSAEIVSGVLSKMVYTSSFFDRVKDTNFNLDNSFSEDTEERREEWEKMVKANASGDGSLTIDVFHPDRQMAENYALANAYVLVNHGKEYHGGDDSIEIKMVSKPFTSQKIASPNLVQNMALGALAGLLISLSLGLFLGFKAEEKKKNGGLNKARDIIDEPLIPISKATFEDEVSEGLRKDVFAEAKNEEEDVLEEEVESEVLKQEVLEPQEPQELQDVQEPQKSQESQEPQTVDIAIPSPFEKEVNEENLGESETEETEEDTAEEEKQESQTGTVIKPELPILENKKKGPLPKELKRNLKKDFYHPESVDSWMKSGKFQPKDVS